MLINLPDALILQRKSQSKTLQKHSTCTFWPTQEYPSSTQSPRVLCNRHFIRCVLSVIQSTSPFLKCFCVPFTTVSPSSVGTLRHYDKNFRRHHWRKNYFKVDNLSSNKELIVSPTIKKKKKKTKLAGFLGKEKAPTYKQNPNVRFHNENNFHSQPFRIGFDNTRLAISRKMTKRTQQRKFRFPKQKK